MLLKDIPLDQRFHDRYVITHGHWLWTHYTDKDGYGILPYKGKLLRAHRVSWMIHHGDIPRGMNVLHQCDVRGCVNPNHLFIGTQADNVKDMIRKGRKRVADFHGERNNAAKLTESDVRAIRRMYASGDITQSDIATRYSVSQTLISQIVRRKKWPHVD